MADNIKNPRGAGRKPLPASEKRKILGVVLPPAMYKYVQNMAESNFMTAPEYVRELIKKDMIQNKR